MKNVKEESKKKNIEKVMFGEDTMNCFACGEKLSLKDTEAERCPYCGTEINKKDIKTQ
ncbi:MAG: hypothetical protein ACQERB_12240 [Promethearchaeati archaeon]